MTTATTATTPTENSDLWFEKFKPIENTSQTALWEYDGKKYGFETYGEDLAVVRKANPAKIWTLIEGDEGQYISAGYHLVNRMGYFICEVAFTDEDKVTDYCDCIYELDDEE